DVHNNVLTVSGESQSALDRSHGFTIRERRCGKYARSFSLPQGSGSEDIKPSKFLSVTFPRSEPEAAL
ncbi:hypothetical protein F5148DRAFT_975692, partial [Russula earlei]